MNASKKRLDELANYPDELTNTSDIPELNDEFWKNAKVVMPKKKKPVSLRLDEDIIQWFKSQGKGYQSRINAVLTSYMRAHTQTA